jgi:hypothetical protein
MSAFILPDYHIDALVSWAAGRREVSYYWDNQRWEINAVEARRVAEMLHDQNVASVNYRYGEMGGAAYVHQWVQTAHLKSADVLKACSSYDYQACETPDYEKSEAARAVNAIRAAAIRAVPGYEDSEAWVLEPQKREELEQTT